MQASLGMSRNEVDLYKMSIFNHKCYRSVESYSGVSSLWGLLPEECGSMLPVPGRNCHKGGATKVAELFQGWVMRVILQEQYPLLFSTLHSEYQKKTVMMKFIILIKLPDSDPASLSSLWPNVTAGLILILCHSARWKSLVQNLALANKGLYIWKQSSGVLTHWLPWCLSDADLSVWLAYPASLPVLQGVCPAKARC